MTATVDRACVNHASGPGPRERRKTSRPGSHARDVQGRRGAPGVAGGEVADGSDEVADAYRDLFTGFPDLNVPNLEPDSLSHHGDLVIGEFRLQGDAPRSVSRTPADRPTDRPAARGDLRVRWP